MLWEAITWITIRNFLQLTQKYAIQRIERFLRWLKFSKVFSAVTNNWHNPSEVIKHDSLWISSAQTKLNLISSLQIQNNEKHSCEGWTAVRGCSQITSSFFDPHSVPPILDDTIYDSNNLSLNHQIWIN